MLALQNWLRRYLLPAAKTDNNITKKGNNKLLKFPIFVTIKKISFFLHKFFKVGDQELAKDLTIEALGKAFKKLHLYVPDYVFSTWLFTIAKNNCIDYLRKNKLPTISIDKLMVNDKGEKQSFDIPAETDNPEQKMIKKQRVQILRQIVEQLKPNYRTLVRLRYFKEMSYEEIADELEIPLGTVKAQLHRSREQLFNIMSGAKGSF